MIFRRAFLEGIRDRRIDLAFRRWRRPTVRSGGRLKTGLGELEIVDVREISIDAIEAKEARRAGFDSLDALRDELNRRTEGTVYRIELGAMRADPRIALREAPLTDATREDLAVRLGRLDARAEAPWTRRYLELLRDHPEVRAGDLCTLVGEERTPFKRNVRKLKNLGLTISLGVGYRISPRGTSWLDGP